MTFYAHLVFCFFGLLKMPWMLQLFLVQEKATQRLLGVVLQKVQKRAGNIRRYHTVCFIPQSLSRSGWFMCRLDIWNKLTVFVLQHNNVLYITEDILCCLSQEMYQTHCDGDHFDSLILNTGLGQKYQHVNIWKPSGGAKAWFSHRNHFKKKRGTVVVHKKLHACMGSTSTCCLS